MSVTEPSGLTVPALRFAPAGMSETVTESVSDPSVSVSAGVMSSAMAVSSVPDAALTVRVGASASPVTETASVSVTVAVSPDSVSVVVTATARVKFASLSAGGVIARPVSSAGVSVTDPSGFTVPALSVAPVGMSETVMLAVSLLSTSVTEMESAMAVSSVPLAALVPSVASAAVPVTVTPRVVVVVAVSPVDSVDVAATDNVKSAVLSVGGVIVRPVSCVGVSVTDPSGFTVPVDKVAPAGMSETVTVRVSEPSMSVSAEVMSRAIAVSSVPEAVFTVRVGASASPVTETASVSLTVAVSPDSVSVVVTATGEGEVIASLSAGGVMVRPFKF